MLSKSKRTNSFRIKANTKTIDYDRNKLLDAVALQDHYSKSMQFPKMPLNRKLFPQYGVRKAQATAKKNAGELIAQELNTIRKNANQKNLITNISPTNHQSEELPQNPELNYMDVMTNVVDK